MKVKNIAFSGFAAAILMGVCGAAQAADPVTPIKLASQGYVTKQVSAKQDKLTAANQGEGIKLNMDENGNLDTISVNWDSVASNDSVTQKISGAITGGTEFQQAVQGAIDKQIEEGAIGTAIESAVTNAVSTKADAADLEALEVTVGQNTQAAADAASAASAAQGTADDAAAAASTNADAITALQEADTTLGGRLDTLEAIDHSQYATNANVAATYATQATVSALTETVGTKAAQSAVDSLSQKVTALETADHFTQDEADARYAGIDTETVAANAASAAATAQTAAEAAAAAASTADDKAVAAQNDVDALESAVEGANYMRGNDIDAGSYLMVSDGNGGITWSSVVVIDADGNDINLVPAE